MRSSRQDSFQVNASSDFLFQLTRDKINPQSSIKSDNNDDLEYSMDQSINVSVLGDLRRLQQPPIQRTIPNISAPIVVQREQDKKRDRRSIFEKYKQKNEAGQKKDVMEIFHDVLRGKNPLAQGATVSHEDSIKNQLYNTNRPEQVEAVPVAQYGNKMTQPPNILKKNPYNQSPKPLENSPGTRFQHRDSNLSTGSFCIDDRFSVIYGNENNPFADSRESQQIVDMLKEDIFGSLRPEQRGSLQIGQDNQEINNKYILDQIKISAIGMAKHPSMQFNKGDALFGGFDLADSQDIQPFRTQAELPKNMETRPVNVQAHPEQSLMQPQPPVLLQPQHLSPFQSQPQQVKVANQILVQAKNPQASPNALNQTKPQSINSINYQPFQQQIKPVQLPSKSQPLTTSQARTSPLQQRTSFPAQPPIVPVANQQTGPTQSQHQSNQQDSDSQVNSQLSINSYLDKNKNNLSGVLSSGSLSRALDQLNVHTFLEPEPQNRMPELLRESWRLNSISMNINCSAFPLDSLTHKQILRSLILEQMMAAKTLDRIRQELIQRQAKQQSLRTSFKVETFLKGDWYNLSKVNNNDSIKPREPHPKRPIDYKHIKETLKNAVDILKYFQNFIEHFKIQQTEQFKKKYIQVRISLSDVFNNLKKICQDLYIKSTDNVLPDHYYKMYEYIKNTTFANTNLPLPQLSKDIKDRQSILVLIQYFRNEHEPLCCSDLAKDLQRKANNELSALKASYFNKANRGKR